MRTGCSCVQVREGGRLWTELLLGCGQKLPVTHLPVGVSEPRRSRKCSHRTILLHPEDEECPWCPLLFFPGCLLISGDMMPDQLCNSPFSLLSGHLTASGPRTRALNVGRALIKKKPFPLGPMSLMITSPPVPGGKLVPDLG